MSALQKRYRVRGLGIEKLLETLQEQGVVLYDITRAGSRAVSFACDLAQSSHVEETAQALGFSLEALPPKGMLHWLLNMRSQAGLWVLALLLCAALTLSLQFIWHIDIRGASIYQGEVRALLREEGIRPGLFRASVNTSALCDALLYRLPRIAWARAKVRGVTLEIDITQGVPVPETDAAAIGNIIADRDGIITHIDVYSGTAAVKAGDTVRTGDVLIYGRERSALDGAIVPVHARGAVYAVFFPQAEATLSMNESVTLPTGSTAVQPSFACPWMRLTLTDAPDYLTSDRETVRIPLGGAWFPMWYEETTYYEAALETVPRDAAAVQSEAGALAMQKLLLLCSGDDEIIDKWINYSMIEGDIIRATAHARLQTQIGVFAPQSDQ